MERIKCLPGENAWDGEFRQGLEDQLLEDPPIALSMKNIAIQCLLRPALTVVDRCLDYDNFRATIDRIDRLLIDSEVESQAIELALEGWPPMGLKARRQRASFAIKALRMDTLGRLLGGISFRHLSRALGSSDLLADFCRVRQIDGIRGISKSTLERASKFFSEEQLRALHRTLTEVVGDALLARQVGLDKPIDTTICLIDGTCLEANIHWPTDWVLLKDVAGTLLKAIRLIREKAGVRHRMPIEPEPLARQMNRLCIQMTHSRRRKDSARQRKGILRQMKKLLKRLGEHARSHRELLQACWEQSDYSEKQVQQILARMERMSEQIPVVIKQAHERIIGGRQVKNAEKVLSVYELDGQVIVRGKAGQEVEFGNTLFLGESVEGYLLDWKLYGSRTPSENEQMQESLQRQNRFNLEEPIAAMCADRGFASQRARRQLAQEGIYDALCPRDPKQLKNRMEEPLFRQLQKRRASTEGRIGVLKNRWQAGRLRSKGFANRSISVAWSVLSHNLWKVAKMLAQQDELKTKAAA